MPADSTLARLDRLVGRWTTEATHVMMPGVVVHGTADVEWLEGGRFLLVRARTDHADFPDSLSVIGQVDRDRANDADAADAEVPDAAPWRLHYFDSRGVFRVFDTAIDETSWRYWRTAPGFSQRFTGRFVGDDTIAGQSELCQDDVHWANDLTITYRRRAAT